MKVYATILRHIKSGGYYYQLRPTLDWRREVDMHEMFAYRPLNPKTDDVKRMVFIRPIEELEDGRFHVTDDTYQVTDMDSKLIELIHQMNDKYRRAWRLIAMSAAILGFCFGVLI